MDLVASTDRPRMVSGSMGFGLSVSRRSAERRSDVPLAPMLSTPMPAESAVLTMWTPCIRRDRAFDIPGVRSYRLSKEPTVVMSSYGGGAKPETRANGAIVVVEPLASRLPEKLSAQLETSSGVVTMCFPPACFFLQISQSGTRQMTVFRN